MASKKGVDLAIAVVFCIAISIPLCVGAVRRFPGDTAAENRLPAEFPAMSLATLAAFPRAFETWFADHLGFRGDLVRASSLLHLRVGVSPTPWVVLGKDGWLFFMGDRADYQYQRFAPFSDQELAWWRWLLESRRDWLAARGVHYLVAFNPNKESIYPDAMPSAVGRLPPPGRLEQLIDELRDHSSLTVVDNGFAVEKARWEGHVVFHHTDSHWNGLGQYAGYSAIAPRLHDWFDVIEPASITAFDVSRKPAIGGDLSLMMGVPLDMPEREQIDIAPKTRRAMPVAVVIPGLPPATLAYEVPDSSLPRALILGDSFMQRVVVPLAEHFRRTVFIPGHTLTDDIIAREAPDVVIDGWVERYLMVTYPELPKDGPTPSPPLGMDLPHPPGIELMPRESWQPHEVYLSGGNSFGSVGQDPWILVQPTAFTATGQQDIWVELTAYKSGPSGALRAQLFFAADGAELWEGASVRFPIVADGQRHQYRVRPSVSPEWAGRIDLLRLDLPDAAPGILYTLHSVKLVGRETQPRTDR